MCVVAPNSHSRIYCIANLQHCAVWNEKKQIIANLYYSDIILRVPEEEKKKTMTNLKSPRDLSAAALPISVPSFLRAAASRTRSLLQRLHCVRRAKFKFLQLNARHACTQKREREWEERKCVYLATELGYFIGCNKCEWFQWLLKIGDNMRPIRISIFLSSSSISLLGIVTYPIAVHHF